MLILGALFVILSLPFLLRGWTLTLRPEGPTALRVRERNLRKGLDADMKRWGRRVRRFGGLLLIIGLIFVVVPLLA